MSWRRAWKRRLNLLRRSQGYQLEPRLGGRLTREKIIRSLAILAFISVLGGTLMLAFLFAWYAKDLPSPDKVVRREGFTTKILARNGEQLYDVFTNERRSPVEFNQVPQELKDATIAIEDKDFYQHQGFDPRGMLRAIFNIIFRGKLQGGSTLTQQLVKNVLLTSERTLTRKIKEFILAVQIERRFSKDQILNMYLNEAPYGGTAWGVVAAADLYFGKQVEDLDLAQAAFLAGMPQRPSVYSPYGSDPTAYVGRTKIVLRRMRDDGKITGEQEEAAIKELEQMEFKQEKYGIKAAHFVMYVKNLLVEQYGEAMVEHGGLTVTTTLNDELQEAAQEVVTEEIAKVEAIDITNGGAIVMDTQTGEILAMVGSKDYFAPDYDGQVNVTLAKRQPGSAIKPVTYVTAFGKGYSPASLIMDVKTEFPGGAGQPPYVPVNYDGKYHGPMSLRTALGSSINIPAVKMLGRVGLADMLQNAYELGFTTLEPSKENLRRFGWSVTLGGGEVRLIDMVAAYSAFANGGLKVEPVAILKIEDKNGKVLYEHKQIPGRRILTEEEAFLINNVLADNNARLLTFGTNSLINIAGRSLAVKTGTTNDQRDNWTVGWTRKTAVGVWVGNNDNSPMKQVASGVSGAAPIWRRIFLNVLKQYPDEPFNPPAGVEERLVDTFSGYPEHDSWPARTDYFIRGTVPTEPDPIHVKLKLCRGENKLATLERVDTGDYEEKEFYILKEADPLSGDGVNRWQQGIDEWVASQGDERYHPPTEYCGDGAQLLVRVHSPEDKKGLYGNEVEIEVSVISAREVQWVKVLVNGDVKETLRQPPYKMRMYFDNGKYTLKFRAKDSEGHEAESGEVRIGVGMDWQATPSPTPTPSPTMTPSP